MKLTDEQRAWLKGSLKSLVLSKVFWLVALLAFGYMASKFWGDDNPVEQSIETVLNREFGVDIDFSPETEGKR